MDYYYDWRPYVSVAARRLQAQRELAKLRKKGRTISPVQIEGRKIARTFWGTAWCENLERYSDFANRLPRGRTYVRNGSVVDLQVAHGEVTALVSGSDLYRVRIGVTAVAKPRWQGICRDCTGAIDSLVELLQGKLSARVMTRICEPQTGLFPEPRDVSFACSCPDWASMCKHVAAVLYGVGARLDTRPELLFLLRGVNEEELIAQAGTGLRPSAAGRANRKVLESNNLSQIFGIEMAEVEGESGAPHPNSTPRRKQATPAVPVPPVKPAAARRTTNLRRRDDERRVSPTPAVPTGSKTRKPARLSTRQRESISDRMKKYWADRRKKRPSTSNW